MNIVMITILLIAGSASTSGAILDNSGQLGNSPVKLADESIVLRVGIISDIHYAAKPNLNDRYYCHSLDKAKQAVETFNNNGTDFLVLLGDNIDETDKETDIENLQRLDDLLEHFKGERHYVLGNHDLGELNKEEFIAQTGGEGNSSYYSFTRGEYFFIILDGNFKNDGAEYSRGNFHWTDSFIPSDQQKWLVNELKRSVSHEKKVIIFIHQILCDEDDSHGVKNADQIRRILEQQGNVLAVFQGHNHKGSYKIINGIHYIGIHPMVVGESNAYAELIICREGSLTLRGFGRQPGMDLIP